MKTFQAVVALSMALGSQANVLGARTDSCCFHLSASGGSLSGTVGQLSDGQNRVGGGLSPAQYCINSGSITDANGRGCILTPPTTQFQCDVGATPTSGFAVGCDGTITYQGSSTFYECDTGDNGEYNIYTQPVSNEACSQIKLTSDGCYSGCPAPTPKPAPNCGTTLNSGSYEYPHLIIPVDSSKPDTAEGTSYNGEVSSTISSIFNFDIPSSDAGKTCSLVFLFPDQSQLQTSSYTFSGNGAIDFAQLSSTASSSTTYNNQPSVSNDLGTTTVAPGNSYVISTFSCPANTAVSYKLSAVGDTYLWYFQDYNPSPIGLYITVC